VPGNPRLIFPPLVASHEDRILPIDRLVADEWGRLNVPDPTPVVDVDPRRAPQDGGGRRSG
jgi:hypothetical protein